MRAGPRCLALGSAAAAAAIVLAACSSLSWGSAPPTPAPWHTIEAPAAVRPPLPPLPSFAPPPTAAEAVYDDYHGESVADPYRWLEDPASERTQAFVAAQNGASRAFLDALPGRPALHQRLQQLWNFPRQGAPMHRGARWFWPRNDGLQNQSVWYVADAPDAAGAVLLDPNALSADGTVALAGFEPSPDGRHVAYAIAAQGSDWQEWRVLDVASGQPRPDVIRWAKFTQAAWTRDGQGFFYQRYPAPQDGEQRRAPNKNPQLCYHRLGEDPANDRVVYERPDQPEWLFRPQVSDSGRFLVLSLVQGTSRQNRIAYVDLDDPTWAVRPLLMDADAAYDFVEHQGDTFWFRTDREAPKGRLVAMDRTDPAAAWTTLVAERRDTLQAVDRLGGRFVCTWLADAASAVTVHDDQGQQQASVALPALGSIGAIAGQPGDDDCYLTFQSFAHAPTVLRHRLGAGTTETFRPSQLQFAGDELVTERKFLQAADGTRLCLFLVHKKGLQLDGSHRTYLYGYGGFGQAMTPRFSVPNLVFVERGGIYAQAVLRGGGEYGEAWHRAGMREHKQKVFDDFLACADYLLRNGYTSPHRLAIGGGSNGGLLVGAALTQAPEKFGAAVPEVGVLDMLRYHRFTIGWAWAPEYGTSDDPAQFRTLFAYSPLHRIRPGTRYPPTLVMTGDHDDRVLPGHSYKFAAALQAAQQGEAPILLRVETAAGHGAGKPVGKLIDEAADKLAFLEAVLGP